MEPVNVVFFFVSTSPLHMHNISFFFATDTVHFFRFLTNVHRSCFLLTVPLSEYSLCRRYQKVIISDSRNGIQVCVLANQLYHIIIAWFLQKLSYFFSCVTKSESISKNTEIVCSCAGAIDIRNTI